jgi:UDP-N-acetylmuramoylalanine--D-glutamate ligase
VEHRLEVFLEKDGVFYINDSKGTNPDSTIKALTAYDRPIILIAGGYDKNSDFSDLMKIIKNRVKYLVLIGATKEKLAAAAEAEGFSDYTIAKSFDEAVKLACNMAAEGDVVMLSPACASWDMFRNFEERGRRFKEIIAALI